MFRISAQRDNYKPKAFRTSYRLPGTLKAPILKKSRNKQTNKQSKKDFEAVLLPRREYNRYFKNLVYLAISK